MPEGTEVTTPIGDSVDTQVEQPVSQSEQVTREDFQTTAPFLRKNRNNSEQVKTEEPLKVEEPKVEEPKQESVTTEPPVAPEKDETNTATKFIMPDGEEMTYEQIVELKKGNMLQADYTRKTQELAEQRKELSKYQDKNLDEAVSLWERLSSDPIGTIRFLEEHYAEQGITEPKDPAVLKYEMELAKKDAELKEKNSLIEAQAAKERQEGFNKHMNMLVDKYKDYNLDIKTVVQYCIDHQLPDPELGFKALAAEQIEKDNIELKKKLEEKQTDVVSDYVKDKLVKNETYKAPVGSGSTGTGVTITKPKTFQEARKSALARLGK